MNDRERLLYWSSKRSDAEQALKYADEQLAVLGNLAIMNDSLRADIAETRTPLIYEEW